MKDDDTGDKPSLKESRRKHSDEWWVDQEHRGNFIWNIVHGAVFFVGFLLLIYGVLDHFFN